MKRLLAVFLAAVMAFALCACGGTSDKAEQTADENTAADNADSTAAADSSIIEFTDLVLVEDETVKIQLENFFEKEYNWKSGAQVEKCMTIKVTNKSENELIVSLNEGYIDDEAVTIASQEGNAGPMPGKSKTFSYRVYQKSPAYENGKALDSLAELYNLEGVFDIYIMIDNAIRSSYKPTFSISEIINGTSAAADDAPAVIYNIGDTVSTDVVEFTLTGFDYVYHLDPTTYAEKEDISGGSVGAGVDMVFANPEYTLKNIAKESVKAIYAAEFTVDYNDGYKFGMNDGNVCYIVDTPGVLWKWASRGSGRGSEMTLSPLSSETYQAYIPANVLIDTDTDSPLLLIVTLTSAKGTEDFVFQIR